MWDERDDLRPEKNTERLTGHNLAPVQRATSDHVPRIQSTTPEQREDGVSFLPPGMLFQEKYQIIEITGEGTLSVVHKARHLVMKNTVAIKLIKSLHANHSRAVLRFQREGQLACRLNHQNIIRTFEAAIARDCPPYVAVEWLDGKSLFELLRDHGAPPLPMAKNFFGQMVDALVAAHAAGFSHRGLKPSNVFVLGLGSPEPHVKICDFGLTDCFDDEEDGSKAILRGEGFYSHPLYMSPEQCQGKALDDRTDIYSLGCVMYEVLTGVPAFNGNTLDEVLHAQCFMLPRPFRDVAPQRYELAELEPIVMKCLAKDPGARYQTMAQVSRAIKDIDEAEQAAQVKAAPIDNSARLAAEAAERRQQLLVQRVLIGACVAILLVPATIITLFKMAEVDVPLPGVPEHVAFQIDRGQYEDGKKTLALLVAEASKGGSKAESVRLLGEQALLEHIMSDKEAVARDDKEIADINETGGSQIYVDQAAAESIDALLASDKSTEDLEKALKEPVQKMVDITQGLAWGQQYGPAQEAMALLIDKLARKLGPTSPLVVDLKLQYGSRLLQKIINPASPLTKKEQQDMVGEPTASLEVPISNSTGTNLLLAKANYALAEAIAGKTDDALKLRDEVVAAYKTEKDGPDNTSLIEVRLADIYMVQDDPVSAMPLFKTAYEKLLSEKRYPQAAYCIGAYGRCAWLAAKGKDCYEFLSGEVGKREVAEGPILRAEIQAWLSDVEIWIATTDDGIVKLYMPDRAAIKKSNGDLRHEAEKLAFESLITAQTTKPCELWMNNPALNSLIKCYQEGNVIGRSVPLLRLKLALAERTNNKRNLDEARCNLAFNLIGYSKPFMSGFYTAYDHTQISVMNSTQEGKMQYDVAFHDATSGSDAAIFWLNPWFAELAPNNIDNDPVKVGLQSACRKSCDAVGDEYGKDCAEYLSQLRWYGRLGETLGNPADSKSKITVEANSAITEAAEVAKDNPKIPLLDRLNAYSEVIRFFQAAGDKAAVKKYTDEMSGLVKH